MSNKITIELCAEDRARLDRLTAALERKACEPCATETIEPTVKEVTEPTVKEEETPTKEEIKEPTPTKTVDRGKLRAKVIELSAKGLKEQTRDIVQAYAPTVAAVPDDKISECYEKLEALEG